MIKLNNKNITYVALADSANSLKAPKEIWYADSANSVKLVYRRKDALIEGEDYEKYHLLNSYTDEGATLPNAGADINVSSIPLDNKVFTIELGQISRNVSVNGKSPWFIPMWCMYVANQYIMQLQERNGNDNTVHNMTYSWNTSNIVTLDFINNVATLGNRTFQIEGTGYTFRGLNSPMWQNPRTVGRIKISDELHLIPCKLLKPVPKWLDANGIRRQIGECGMIDLVSGKFYGNVNSVGTFTVENYYERKEWLVGDGSAYIDTLITDLSVSDYIKTIFDDSGNIGVSGRTWGREGNRLVVGNDGSSTSLKVWGTSSSFVYNNDGIYIYDMYFDLLNDNVTINNQIFTLSLPHGNGINFLLFAWHRNISPRVDSINLAKYKSFEIHNQINLIPCTLTMDLPASMDANNIPRTKGTSGMWDLVSDRFYGNVANSGTFKAVNLAEGVDYEVHQWLKGDGTAYIDTNIIVNSSTLVLSIKSKASSYGALCGSRNGASLNPDTTAIHYQNGRYRLDLLSVNNNYVWADKDNLEDTFNIDLASNTAVVNGTSFTSSKTHTNSINTFRVFGCFGANVGYNGYINKFMLNDSYNNLNLVPVKLLKSIHAKYDANGRARNAGECGMYDTVNDVFYGNVASSGSFTVEDDS